MPPLDPLTVALCLLAAAAAYLVRARNSKQLPPGPSSLPLVGNLWHVPLRHPWLAFTEWGKTYGEQRFFPSLRG